MCVTCLAPLFRYAHALDLVVVETHGATNANGSDLAGLPQAL